MTDIEYISNLNAEIARLVRQNEKLAGKLEYAVALIDGKGINPDTRTDSLREAEVARARLAALESCYAALVLEVELTVGRLRASGQYEVSDPLRDALLGVRLQ